MFRLFSKCINTTNATDNEPCSNDVQVFVWSGDLRNPGHVSLKFNDENPNNPPYYASIWPKATPAGGLTSFFPLQATFSDSLESDCKQEATSPPDDFKDLMETREMKPVSPDQTFCIKGLDKNKIKAEIDRLKADMENGKTCYQLLPGVNTLGLFKKIRPFNPISETYNCVTLTNHLLKTGGLDQLKSATWSTPSQFGSKLREELNNNEIKNTQSTMKPT